MGKIQAKIKRIDTDILSSWTFPINILKSRFQNKEYYKG